MIESFLQQVELKAFKIAQLATKSEADALDLVQSTMLKMVEKYAGKPEEEWRPLFYTILQNQIKNWYRKQANISKWIFWQKTEYDIEDDETVEFGISHQPEPAQALELTKQSESLLVVLENLPVKQQQVFLLRSWEGLSVKETARVMDCSEGTVKTHMSRATQKLLAVIEEEERSV